MECIISRASIVNRCITDGKVHYHFTEKERPCKEAYLKDIIDNSGNPCSRYCIDVQSVKELDQLGEEYENDVLVTKNLDFSNYITLLLCDEPLIKSY